MLLICIGIFCLNVRIILFVLFGVFFKGVVKLNVFFGGVVYGFFKILYLLVFFYKFWLIEYGEL